ncbi:MAG: hypothetical protein DHS20C18_23790 [Saprospiraceae bacterium]|nr:MAG: hypothetical protein DHS20C18_23790 [Saprospiraceae bacterium]
MGISCNNEDDSPAPVENGAIFVTVKYFGQFIGNATVTTDPPTELAMTNSAGSVLINDVAPGIYQVNALHPDIGEGISAVTVLDGQVANTTINLIAGAFDEPMVSFIAPENAAFFGLGSDVQFSVNVSDNQENPEAINLEWKSSLDGVFSTQKANNQGLANVAINSLSEGEHTIEVTATDSDNNTAIAQLSITIKVLPNPVTLNPIETESNGLSLSWSVSEESTFQSYRVYRSAQGDNSYDIIEVINDINTTTFYDQNIQFGILYSYKIGVLVANGDEAQSNIESQQFFGENIDVGTQIEVMKVDPVRPYIYALDKVNNSLHFINTDDKVLEKTIFVGSSPTGFDLNPNGDLLYIANFGSSELTVVDLNTQEISTTLFVDTNAGTWDGNPYRIVYMENNKLVFTSEDQWNNLKIVNASNGSLISYTDGSIYQPEIITNPGRTIIYAAESSLSTSTIHRFNLVGNNLQLVDENGIDGYAARALVSSGNGQYLFYHKRKILANNLQSVLGTFSENIYASNVDGTKVIGEENILDAVTFSIIRPLPLSTRIMALAPDNETLYLYDTNTSKIAIVNIN